MEPTAEEVLPKKPRKKRKGQRELDLKDFPEEIIPPYTVSEDQLDAFYGKGNWRRMPDETYKRPRHEPESWTVEVHTVEVYVGATWVCPNVVKNRGGKGDLVRLL